MIDYSKVVTKEYFNNMDKEKLEALKQEAEKRKIHYESSNNRTWIETRAKKITYNEYPNLTLEEKQILASNICLNDEKVINALLNKEINYNTLYYYSTLISKIKSLNIEETIENKKINYICSIIRLYFGVSDFNLIATKLNEIVATKKDLYLKQTRAKSL